MTDIDTSVERVEDLADELDNRRTTTQPHPAATALRALLSEREALAASCEEWMKALGAVLGALPLSEIVSAGASVGDTIAAVKARFETATTLEAENSALKAQLAEARNAALNAAMDKVDWYLMTQTDVPVEAVVGCKAAIHGIKEDQTNG